jgi:hypothetical protein
VISRTNFRARFCRTDRSRKGSFSTDFSIASHYEQPSERFPLTRFPLTRRFSRCISSEPL